MSAAPDLSAIDLAMHEAFALLPPSMTSKEAEVLLWAIGFQESEMTYRRQLGNGPARGLLQFERGGGVFGVASHPATSRLARRVATARGVPFSVKRIWEALEHDDVLAFAFGRLLLYSDPAPLPRLGFSERAYAYYIHNWRPGKPRPEKWAANYARALEAIGQLH